MKTQKDDRRSRRSRHMISAALVELLREQRYDEITVQSILERANVGRSTFYSHYHDKEDVLVSSFEGVLELLREHMREAAGQLQLLPSLALFQHVQSHQHLYRALVRSQGIEPLFRKSAAYLGQMVEQRLRAQAGDERRLALPLTVIATHVAGALITLLRWWLDQQLPCSPEELDDYFQRLVMPGVLAAMNG